MNVELLLRVKAAILEEPRRINMRRWSIAPSMQKYYQKDGPPPCNTVACIAGWAVALVKNLRGDALFEFNSDETTYSTGYIESAAEELLGLDENSRQILLFIQNWPQPFFERMSFLNEGTPDYARAVADRIDHFIATKGRE